MSLWSYEFSLSYFGEWFYKFSVIADILADYYINLAVLWVVLKLLKKCCEMPLIVVSFPEILWKYLNYLVTSALRVCNLEEFHIIRQVNHSLEWEIFVIANIPCSNMHYLKFSCMHNFAGNW